jgi:Rps23 Pro-64 3,4-dihydroxylase Tpa1-like proline 4-hydroxylase
MKVIKHKDGIYEVEKFLTDEELQAILESTKEDNFIEVHPGNIVQDLNQHSLSFIPEICARMMSYFENPQSHTKITNIRRLKTNEFMYPHKDNDSKYTEHEIIFGVIIYLNDNFVGGELKYTDIGFSIKPKSASMVIHNTDIKHEVLPVISGNRYCLTSFIYGDSNTKFKINLLQ